MALREMRHFKTNLESLCQGYGAIQRIADRAGVTRPYLSNIIHGKVSPSLENAVRIAEACDMDLSTLLLTPKEFATHLESAT